MFSLIDNNFLDLDGCYPAPLCKNCGMTSFDCTCCNNSDLGIEEDIIGIFEYENIAFGWYE